MKLIDSHCHLHLLDLSQFDNNMDSVLEAAKAQGVEHMLCVSVELEQYPQLCELASLYKQISISVGLHPNHITENEPSANDLVKAAQHPACVAIGETGLDYYRVKQPEDIVFQQTRFINHIQAACTSGRPLIIHTRQASQDTISYLKAENAMHVGGVMHCFTETWEVARAALDLGFYISFSGIVTFKNAVELQDVAKKVPLDRILIETDSPYLAPAPFRGQQNHPALVYRVAEMIAELRGLSVEEVAALTSSNFYQCFPLAKVAR